MFDSVLQTAAFLSVQSGSAGASDIACVHANPVGELIAFRFGFRSAGASDFACVHANPVGELIAFWTLNDMFMQVGLKLPATISVQNCSLSCVVSLAVIPRSFGVLHV